MKRLILSVLLVILLAILGLVCGILGYYQLLLPIGALGFAAGAINLVHVRRLHRQVRLVTTGVDPRIEQAKEEIAQVRANPKTQQFAEIQRQLLEHPSIKAAAAFWADNTPAISDEQRTQLASAIAQIAIVNMIVGPAMRNYLKDPVNSPEPELPKTFHVNLQGEPLPSILLYDAFYSCGLDVSTAPEDVKMWVSHDACSIRRGKGEFEYFYGSAKEKQHEVR